MSSPRANVDLSAYLGVKMSPELRERIDRAAARQGRDASNWVRRVLRRRLDAEERVREDAAPASQ